MQIWFDSQLFSANNAMYTLSIPTRNALGLASFQHCDVFSSWSSGLPCLLGHNQESSRTKWSKSPQPDRDFDTPWGRIHRPGKGLRLRPEPCSRGSSTLKVENWKLNAILLDIARYSVVEDIMGPLDFGFATSKMKNTPNQLLVMGNLRSRNCLPR